MYDSNRYQLSIQKYTHIQSSVFFTFVPPLGSMVSIICPLDSKMSVKVDYSIIFWCLFARNHLGLAFQFWLFQHKYNFGFTWKILHFQKWIWLEIHSTWSCFTELKLQIILEYRLYWSDSTNKASTVIQEKAWFASYFILQ